MSTYYLLMKFFTRHGIGEVQRDQTLARYYYTIALQGMISLATLLMEGLDTRDELTEEQGEPLEDLVTILLNDGNDGDMVQIGLNLNKITQN